VQYISSSWRQRAPSLLPGLVFLVCAGHACAADIYNPTTRELTLPSISIGNATYSNMVVTPASILCIQGGEPDAPQDTYNPVDSQMNLLTVTAGTTSYTNVQITVGSLVSIGGVSGADTYDGAVLTIPSVQLLGGLAYNNVKITVGRIISAGGGMPTKFMDEYNPATKELTIPVVQVGSRIYTNAIITVGTIESVGGPQAVRAMSHPLGTNSGTCSVPPLDLVVSALPGGASGGLVVPVGGTGSIAAIAVNQTSQDLSAVHVSASTGAATLPLTITMCLIQGGDRDCSTPPGTALTIPSIPPGVPPNYLTSPVVEFQVSASAAIANDPANQILISFTTGNNALLATSSVPVQTIVPQLGIFVATASGNGTVTVPVGQMGAFAVEADNAGAHLTGVTVSASTNLPVTVTLCQTTSIGQCLSTPGPTVALASLDANATATLSVFVSAPTALPNNPAANLLFIDFETSDGTVVGSASVGVTTN
jgi:hypothetical protein